MFLSPILPAHKSSGVIGGITNPPANISTLPLAICALAWSSIAINNFLAKPFALSSKSLPIPEAPSPAPATPPAPAPIAAALRALASI